MSVSFYHCQEKVLYELSLFIQKHPLEVFYEKAVLKNFLTFVGKHLCWSHFLTKLQASRCATLLKSESSTDAFL